VQRQQAFTDAAYTPELPRGLRPPLGLHKLPEYLQRLLVLLSCIVGSIIEGSDYLVLESLRAQ